MRLVLGCLLGVALLIAESSPVFASDAAKGKQIFTSKCGICHQVGPNAKTLVGPELNNIVGRKAASIKGFPYSPGMKKLAASGWVWTEANINKWITDPKKVVPSSPMAMAFPGLPSASDRADVIAYLKTASK